MKKTNYFVLLFAFIMSFSVGCPGFGPGEKSATIYCFVFDQANSSGISNATVYYSWEISDLNNAETLDETGEKGKYIYHNLNGIHAGYLLATHQLYSPDTLKTDQVGANEIKTVTFYLRRK